jgi:hypothetical protein
VAFFRVTAGAALPVVSAALAFDPGRFLYWIATGSGSYLSADGAGLKPLLRALAGIGLLTLAALPLVIALVHAVRSRTAAAAGPVRAEQRVSPEQSGGPAPAAGSGSGNSASPWTPARLPLDGTRDLWIWLAVSLGAATVGFQFFGHYFLQLTPPLALLGAAALRELTVRAATTALAATAFLACGFVGWGFTDSRTEVDHARRLADTVRSYTDRHDRVLLWGMHPEAYWLAQRSPASRYLTAGFLTNFSGGRGETRVGERYAMEGAWPHFERELRRRPPELIVDDSRGKGYGVQSTPTLRRHVARHYEKVATIDGSSFYLRNRPEVRTSSRMVNSSLTADR